MKSVTRRHVLVGLVSAVPALAFAAPAEGKHRRRRRRGFCQSCGGKHRCGLSLKCVNGRCVDKSDAVVCGDAYEACPAKLAVFCSGTGGAAECCNTQGHNCSPARTICPN